MEFLQNKKIGILGLGVSNLYAVNYLKRFTKNIFISEEKKKEEINIKAEDIDPSIEYEFGKNSERILECDLIIRSPGIPYHHKILKEIKSKNIEVFTELEFSFRILKHKLKKIPKIIAITGTNGKSTTTSLVGSIFSNFTKTIVAGNIGTPLINFIDDITEDTTIVLEVSSYQLEDIKEFKPYIGCILNITEDHLEHHLTMEEYAKAKFNMFKNQTPQDIAVLKYDDVNILKTNKNIKINSEILYFSIYQELSNGCFLEKEKNTAIFKNNKITKKIKIITQLPGDHNMENILASICCSILDIPTEIIEKTIFDFKGIEHRLEFVRDLDGVIYINDSKSTNVDSTSVALKSFNKPLHLILGGRDKGAPYTPLIPLIKQKAKSILLIGEASTIIYNQIKDCGIEIYLCNTLDNAVNTARKIATKGDIVLLSPACSSFDQFKNFEHRGKVFKCLVNNLK
ncbi:MAG: UDP-N-acetylmuramoyl-L-alanine--D-glutamate ligase [Endomicrobia bacterium]|nr:UDP-N-acetylmuramoyl-L-alanine--D-glutamate ligase [Endomicrobiia bacterium]